MRTVYASLLLLLPFAGCDDTLLVPDPGCPPGFSGSDTGCAFDEAAVADLMRSFDGGRLVRINAGTFEQSMGGPFERNVWMSPLPVFADNVPVGIDTVDLYKVIDPHDRDAEVPAAFPVGTLIVHETVNREEGHTVQVKLGDAYSDEMGRDWWFGKYFDDGTPDLNACSPCWSCHNEDARPGTDGLIGVPTDAL